MTDSRNLLSIATVLGDATPAPTVSPLAVFVAWHEKDDEGTGIAKALVHRLSGNPEFPASPRLGIPVRFRSISADSTIENIPEALPAGGGKAVVLCIAGPNFLADTRCRDWARHHRLWAEAHPEQVRMLVLAQTDAAFGATDLFGTISQMRRAEEVNGLRWTRDIEISVLGAVIDLLGSGSRPRVFVSHAKADGASVAKELVDRVSEAKLGVFFDKFQIVEGSAFDDVISSNLEAGRSALISIVTDAYSSREWCRREALQAKRQRLPIVVIDAVSNRQNRSFPYLGNVPVFRLNENQREVFDDALVSLLAEVASARWFPSRSDDASDEVWLAHPPELITVVGSSNGTEDLPPPSHIIHPDPPLASTEAELLTDTWPNIHIETPVTRQARLGADPTTIQNEDSGKRETPFVAVSISDPPADDLARRGLSPDHVNLAFIETATHLLAAGYGLAYGGDLRFDGFTTQLLDLVASYPIPGKGDEKRVRNYLAQSLYELTLASRPEDVASALNLAEVEPVASTHVTADMRMALLDGETVEEQTLASAVIALDLAAMREKTSKPECAVARILFGGKVVGSSGTAPGLVEEAYRATLAGQPMYVIGGFGGGAEVVAQTMTGRDVDDFARAIESAPARPIGGSERSFGEAARDFADSTGAPVTCAAEMVRVIADTRSTDNGLSTEENQMLMTTDDLATIVSLILRGLGKLGTGGAKL